MTPVQAMADALRRASGIKTANEAAAFVIDTLKGHGYLIVTEDEVATDYELDKRDPYNEPHPYVSDPDEIGLCLVCGAVKEDMMHTMYEER